MWSDGYSLAAGSPALQAGVWKGTRHCTASTDLWLKPILYNCLLSKFSFPKGLGANHKGFMTGKVMGNSFMLLVLYQIFTVNNSVCILASTSADWL